MAVLRKAFDEALDGLVSDYIASIDADRAMVEQDVRGSLAHVRMLERRKLVSRADASKLRQGLGRLLERIRRGEFELNAEFEDVHMNVEKALEAEIGEPALRLHTARSRNDQVALDLRLYVLDRIDELAAALGALRGTLLRRAAETAELPMPGYTHLQRAVPVAAGHVLHAFSELFRRDVERLADARVRTAVSPLGAGPLAGSSLAIDPAIPAKELGLPRIFANSIDAVSDRDFAAEFAFACALAGVHLSQVAENLILWVTSEFGFARLPDSLTTGSSIMPHKKNPDALEIVRAKSGALTGELVNLLVVLKALPFGYNRDLQETKPPVVRAAGLVLAGARIVAQAVDKLRFNPKAMRDACSDPNLYATDLVEFLVSAGRPFREAHSIVAELVKAAAARGVSLAELPFTEYKNACPAFTREVYKLFHPDESVASKSSPGGTGRVKRALKT
jgi:argininosuccinate lyase